MKTFCPNCEKETESTFICEVHCCNECDEDNGNYEKPLTTKLQSEIARLTARVRELEDEEETYYSAWKCGWCNERFTTPAEAMSHALSCETHPLVQRVKELEDALNNLYEACLSADIEGELSERVTGVLLDAARQVINRIDENLSMPTLPEVEG